MGAIKKVGITFHAKIDTNRDLIGAEDQFTAEVIDDATGTVYSDGDTLGSGTVSIGAFSEVGSTGIYRAPINIPEEGDYTISVKWTDGTDTEYIPFPVELKAADMTDIKNLIDALQADMTDVKEQVDILDEAELNNIAEQVITVQDTVDNIKSLVAEYVGSFVVSGDETALLTAGSEVLGDTTGAKGTIIEVTLTGDGDTAVTIDNQEGVFSAGETVSVDGVSTTGTILSVANNPVNSVMEFVEAINSALSEGGSSLDALASYTDNIELMLEGKEYTDTNGNVVSEADSKGLIEIYDAIAANGVAIADNNTAISALSSDVADLRTSVEAKVDAVQATIDGALDETDENSLISKVNAVKTVVDANSAVLTDSVYGNEAIKNLLNTVDTNLSSLVTDFADGGRLEVRFDDIDTAIANVSTAVSDAQTAIQNDISALSTSLDDKYAALDSKLDSIAGSQQYKGFV